MIKKIIIINVVLTTKQNPEMSNQGNFKCRLVFKAQAVLFSLLLIIFFS